MGIILWLNKRGKEVQGRKEVKRQAKDSQKKQHLDPTFKTEPLEPALIFWLLNSQAK